MKTLPFVLFALTACATSADPDDGFDDETDDSRVPEFCNATDPRKIPVPIVPDPEADGKQAYLGSVNFSQTSLDHNREVGFVVVEPSSIAPLSSTFESDWARGAQL